MAEKTDLFESVRFYVGAVNISDIKTLMHKTVAKEAMNKLEFERRSKNAFSNIDSNRVCDSLLYKEKINVNCLGTI